MVAQKQTTSHIKYSLKQKINNSVINNNRIKTNKSLFQTENNE